MVKKQKTPAQDEGKQAPDAAQPSAYQIWQAGLGAFVKAQEEGGRVFNLLVQENNERQQRSGSTPEAGAAAPNATNASDGVSGQADGASDRLEQVFEERVARALGSLGVPTHKDIETLTRQIEQLQQLVAELSGRSAPVAGSTPVGRSQPAAQAAAAQTAAGKAVRKPAVKAAPVLAKTIATPAVKAAPAPATTIAAPAAKAAPKKPLARKAAASKAGADPATEA